MELYSVYTYRGEMRKQHPQLKALGKQIRKHRLENGYSQEMFAIEAGLDRSYYGGVERGENNVAAINLIKIAAALELEVGDLFPKINFLLKAK